MTTITIVLSDEQLSKLKETATYLGVAPEELVSAGIEELLNERDQSSNADLPGNLKQGLSPKVEARYAELNAKRWEETLTPEEHSELLRLNEQIEELQTQRIKLLIELARLRKTSLATLIDSLGIRPRT